MSNHLMNTYARLPVSFDKGQGALLFDANGQAYLDAVSGIAVCSLGHAHPDVSEAICNQSHKLIHTSNLYQIENQQQLADRLIDISGMDRVFFSNSGAEANEAAIKIAKKYGHQKDIDKAEIIVMENSFHGRTMATLSATGNAKVQEGFTPLVEGFIRVPFDDIEAVKAHSSNPNIVAILVEPIQGEGGVHIPQDGYLSALKAICEEHGWLLMLDEIQTGLGRTGKWFAGQHDGVTPDVMTLAKALGNGVPIGACLAKGKAAEVLAPGNHGTTFGGNPLACAAGLAVLNALTVHNHIEQVAKKGEALLNAFKQSLSGVAGVKQIRGRGYMLGIQLDRPCGELVSKALENKLLINVTRQDTVRLLPAFVMTQQQSDQLVEEVTQLIKDFLSQ
ncbi:aspartate aminotransferase family protein [Thiomicrorhabdus heinhorstiae]|uniref:Acetylornithine aminotransferase n=1 Tax=Thiomicrorhabdus heinhorstiae TaxID=2748010 RepID=A0ABS0BXZ1_9GAMM|nr:aspartate aminotransferase family protein [Thiomicrorhabdus heinhorstiae]MBF6058645.1 aspartate aminotransferase family protein [Thiomicrorhabdus heinhorstiae]